MSSPSRISEEVVRYLRTGETDPYYVAWPGSFLERAKRANRDLRDGLVREVRRLAEGHSHRLSPGAETVALTRHKVEPMVRGLFARTEQDVVLRMLKTSVVFLTSENVERVLLEQTFEHSARHLANLYLSSLGA